MDKNEMLLASLSTGENHLYTPVQIQKLLFLIDKNISQRIGGPFYNFAPYDYGPFDASVYSDIRDLVSQGFMMAQSTPQGWSTHVLTEKGLIFGKDLLSKLPSEIIDYISRVGNFVRNTPFPQLVSAIYKEYPEMAANSVFRRE